MTSKMNVDETASSDMDFDVQQREKNPAQFNLTTLAEARLAELNAAKQEEKEIMEQQRMLQRRLNQAQDRIERAKKELEDIGIVRLLGPIRKLPSVLQQKIAEFLKSKELWNYRIVSRAFHQSYFLQRINRWNYEKYKFNGKRAISLARKMGSVFKHVEALDIDSGMEWSLDPLDLAAINSHSFPRLKKLWLRGKLTMLKCSLDNLPSLPQLEFFQIHPKNSADVMFMTDEKFPKLTNVVLNGNTRVSHLPTTTALTTLTLRMPTPANVWDLLTRARYPNLTKVHVKRQNIFNYDGSIADDVLCQEIRGRLQAQNIAAFIK